MAKKKGVQTIKIEKKEKPKDEVITKGQEIQPGLTPVILEFFFLLVRVLMVVGVIVWLFKR